MTCEATTRSGKRGMGTWGRARQLLQELPHAKILLASPPNELVRLITSQLVEMPQQDVVYGRRDGLVVRMRATGRLRNDLVDDLELEQVRRGDPQRRRRLLAH